MKRSRLLTLLVGGVFCLAVMSLYRMLELMQGAEPQPRRDAPDEQDLSRLQQKIDRLERLLSDNNRLVARLRDSLLQHKASWERGGGGANVSSDSTHSQALLFPDANSRNVKYRLSALQLLDVYDLLPFDNPDGGAWKQGFEIGYRGDEWDEQPLELFLVPHSHNDPGWLKTFDGYYQDQTRHILDNMLQKLSQDHRRKMVWAEISYFSKWWNDIDDQKRATVKRLVGAGQLELVTGGWVMADEANSHYFALLDQLMEGHQWLHRHLGVTPSSGWAIDPFGHSPSMTYLLKGAGLQNMVIQRVHYAVKKHFARQQTLEFLWRQTWDSSPRSDITCHMMPFYSYDVPHTCGPNPAVCCQFDFHRLPGRRVFCPWRVPPQPITDQNVQERALLLLDQYRQKSQLFRSPVLLVPLGDDFRFVETSEWDVQFTNYQKLFDYFEQHPELHIKARFGTLSDYFQALHRRLGAAGTSLPTLRGDFFTYADRDDHYWSGFFTSRPFYKRLDRTLEATLRATEILFSLTLAEMRRFGADGRPDARFPARDHFRRLTVGRRNLGLFQHHDAVTGTGRDPVVVDYGTRGGAYCTSNPNPSKGAGLTVFPTINNQYPDYRIRVLIIDCFRSLIVFNPTEQLQTSVISVTVDSPDAHVVDAETGRPMAAQISAAWVEPSQVSTEMFQVRMSSSMGLLIGSVIGLLIGSVIGLLIHVAVALLRGRTSSSVLRLPSGRLQQLQVQFLWYGTRTGTNQEKSGAYLFLPGEDGPQVKSPLVRVSRGPIFSDITSCFQHFTHTVRLFHLDGHAGKSLEISNMVDIRSEVNRELVMRFVSDVANGNRFYSDLNGFQMQQRRTLLKLPLQANFYPMTSAAFLQDSGSRLTLLSAQSQAVASLRPGELEVVLDRRLQQDDNRGLGQGITDNKLTASLYHLLLEDRRGGAQEVGGATVEHLSLLAHLTSLSLSHPPITMVAPSDSQLPKLRPFLPLRLSLPCDIHLLNLRTLEDTQVRSTPGDTPLKHLSDVSCWSWTTGRVNLEDLFSPLRFRSVRHSSLTLLHDEPESAWQPQRITRLRPMEISAFRVQLD
uniref:Alpha-mannosidase n=1 Tax=Amphiprion ocellaris TaxID=80972 RepID=A0AAQ5XI56_AMPOC